MVEFLTISAFVAVFAVDEPEAVDAVEALEHADGVEAPLKFQSGIHQIPIASPHTVHAEVTVFALVDVISPARNGSEESIDLLEHRFFWCVRLRETLGIPLTFHPRFAGEDREGFFGRDVTDELLARESTAAAVEAAEVPEGQSPDLAAVRTERGRWDQFLFAVENG
jgi:hypothetical protein